VVITNENIGTYLFTGPNNVVVEYAGTGSTYFGYIMGSSGSFMTLAYPRIYDAGFSTNTGSSLNFNLYNVSFQIQQQPMFRNPVSNNVFLLKATQVNDTGDRDFVFQMVSSPTDYPTTSNVEQSQIITVAGQGDLATIVGTTGNTSYYKPFSLVSATGVQNGEIFEIWVAQ